MRARDKQMSRTIKPSTSVVLVTALLLFVGFFGTAESSRTTLQADNKSSDVSPAHANEQNKRAAALSSELLQDSDEHALAVRHLDEGTDGPLISFPQFIDHVMSSAFSSVDRMSSGLLSGLAGPNVDFAKTDDGKRLIARLRLPATPKKEGEDANPPKLSVAVLGRSHLRVKLDIRSGGFQSISEHTYGLPAYVSSDGVTVTPQDDGTVHVSLRILKEASEIAAAGDSENASLEQKMGSFLQKRMRNPLFPILIQRSSQEMESDDEVVEELPKPEEVARCRAQHANDKMLRTKCICDATPSSSARAVCYGSFISKAVSAARRLGMNDFATNAKHHAIECADGHVDAVECLENVASALLVSLNKKNNAGNSTIEDRVRAAIESEDDGPSSFGPSYGTIFSFFLILSVVAIFIYGVLCYLAEKLSGSPRTSNRAEILAGLVSGGQGSRLGPFQGTSMSPKVRAGRKANVRSRSGDSKLA